MSPVLRWCDGSSGRAPVERLQLRLPSVLLWCSDSGKVVHTHVPVMQYKLVLVKGWCSAATKVNCRSGKSNGRLLLGLWWSHRQADCWDSEISSCYITRIEYETTLPFTSLFSSLASLPMAVDCTLHDEVLFVCVLLVCSLCAYLLHRSHTVGDFNFR